jgi:signal transduction histidine kinase
VPLLLGSVLAVHLVLDAQQRQVDRVDGALRAAVATAVVPTGASIRNQLGRAAVGPATGDVTVPVEGGGASGPSLDARTSARDSGLPVLDESAGSANVVAPLFRPGAPVATTGERRIALTGFRVVPLTVQVADLAPEGGGLVLRGPEGHVVAMAGPSPASGRSFGVDLQLADQPGWRLEARLPEPGTPTSAWLEALAVLAVAALGAGLVVQRQRQRAAEARERRQLERDRGLIAGLAPIVQTSLDLGQVVPAVSTHLIDGLSLAGFGLSVPSDSGERQLFTWGQAPRWEVPAVAAVPEVVEPGETYALTLTRGGRLLGTLRVVAGEPLRQADLLALATASELLGSTLANAEAFNRQQLLVERMRSVDELKTVFLATASHELRTPVTAIVGFAGLLLSQWDTLAPEQGRMFLERVLANAKGLETLIEQLLDFSRLERGMHPAGDEQLDLGERIAAVLAEQPDLYGRHELRTQLAPDCLVRGSGAAVERIVTNLVGNAA